MLDFNHVVEVGLNNCSLKSSTFLIPCVAAKQRNVFGIGGSDDEDPVSSEGEGVLLARHKF